MTTETPARLPRLFQLCENIGRILSGLSAKALLETEAPRPLGAVVTLPSWIWVIPKINVGRKGVVDGVLQTMPSRLEWADGPVHLVADRELTVTWHLSGLGNKGTGTATVRLDSLATEVEVDLGDGLTVTANVQHTVTPGQVDRALRQIVREGEGGRWALMTGFEFFTRQKLVAANRTVAGEIAQHKGIPLAGVVDDITIEDLVASMLYGENGTSVVHRMIDRALAPHQFDRVDPMHWFAFNIRARAEEAIRRQIGDPKVGPKVRRVFAMYECSTIDEVIEKYRELYPGDSLARKRALAALTAGPDISTTQRIYRDETTSAPEDSLIETEDD